MVRVRSVANTSLNVVSFQISGDPGSNLHSLGSPTVRSSAKCMNVCVSYQLAMLAVPRDCHEDHSLVFCPRLFGPGCSFLDGDEYHRDRDTVRAGSALRSILLVTGQFPPARYQLQNRPVSRCTRSDLRYSRLFYCHNIAQSRRSDAVIVEPHT